MEGIMENIEKVMDLHHMVMEGNQWEHVVFMFRYDPDIQTTMINWRGDTALHVAFQTSSDDIVEQLVGAIRATQRVNTLSLKNAAGDTPLHAAATRGSLRMCRCFLDCQKSLIMERNKHGETPVFLAAINGHRDAFLHLFHAAAKEDRLSCCRRLSGETVLHCTIKREYFDMSLLILRLCNKISYWVNEKGQSPLAILASTPSAFISGIHFSWWERLLFRLIYAGKSEISRTDNREEFIVVELGDLEMKHQKLTEKGVVEKLVTFETVFRFSEKIKRRLLGLEIMKHLVQGDSGYDALIDTDIRHTISTWDDGMGSLTGASKTPASNYPEPVEQSLTALLSATKNGATELVREILKRKSFAIHDETRDKKNMMLVAIEARQSDTLREVMKHPSWNNEKRLMYAKDVKGNTALHLAAKRSVNHSISLPVLHLQWEVHWFEYVKESMPPYFMNEPNNEGKTPWMIFEEDHCGMLKESDKWVKEMSGNYMVATTLISSVTFATCFQIPGGYDGKQGTPIVGSSIAFQLFAITALVSFCFSITSLAAFLAIYSSRSDQYRHYRRALPLKLLVGFFSLFISIVSMLISFCSAHVFELDPNHKSKSIPLYLSLTSVPLCFYSATQIPLYLDLLIASLAPVPFSRPFYVGQQEVEEEEN